MCSQKSHIEHLYRCYVYAACNGGPGMEIEMAGHGISLQSAKVNRTAKAHNNFAHSEMERKQPGLLFLFPAPGCTGKLCVPQLDFPLFHSAARTAHVTAAALFVRLADFDGIPDIWPTGAAGAAKHQKKYIYLNCIAEQAFQRNASPSPHGKQTHIGSTCASQSRSIILAGPTPRSRRS